MPWRKRLRAPRYPRTVLLGRGCEARTVALEVHLARIAPRTDEWALNRRFGGGLAAMRAYPGERLRTRLRELLGEEGCRAMHTDRPILERERPFDNPVYWAAFVVNGEG